MTLPKGQIERQGSVYFNDASLSVWEEGIPREFDAARAWELIFKRQVFSRIVQTLNRLGWTCVVPESYVKQYSLSFARDRRECSKGELKGWLELSGRTISFEMWQGVNTPTRPDHGGRYESNKEACAPYLLRLEMIRTRIRIRDYLCNVFSGYTFVPPKISSPNPDPLAYFNESWDGEYERKRGTHRFKRGADGWPDHEHVPSHARIDADGVEMDHGDIRWLRDRSGRLLRGRVYGGINSMWMLVYGRGKHDFTHEHHNLFFTYRAGLTPIKLVPAKKRRTRLEQELQHAIRAMAFKRAEALKNVLFPSGPLFAIYHKEHKAYFAVMYCGYRNNLADAGKYTRSELKQYLGDQMETERFKAVPVAQEMEIA